MNNFEFTIINKKYLLLISETLLNSLENDQLIKLKGKPIGLTASTNKLKIVQHREIKQVMRSVGKTFRNKSDLLGALEDCLKLKGETTLSTIYLNQYLHSDNRIPIIVFWNGTTEKEIFKRLKLNIKKMWKIICYSDNNDNYFNIKLFDITGVINKLLYSSKIGYHQKNGRMLNLIETHGLICEKNHNITHNYDPNIADNIIIKCIFNYIKRDMGPIKLHKLCKIGSN